MRIQSTFSLPSVVLEPLSFTRAVVAKAQAYALQIQYVRLEGPIPAQCALDTAVAHQPALAHAQV
jgi:hypothetical protein